MKSEIMEWIKKYWKAILIILALPIVINFILLIPALSPIVGDNVNWLSFWGSYLGAIISAGAAFVILHIQREDAKLENKQNRLSNEEQNNQNRIANKKQNDANRQLQLNIMKYHQQSQWLDNFRNAGLEYYQAFNRNDVVLISNIMWENPHEALNMLKVRFDSIGITSAKFSFFCKRDEAAKLMSKELEKHKEAYVQFLHNLQWLVLYFRQFLPTHRSKSHFLVFLHHSKEKHTNAQITHIINVAQSTPENMVNGNKLYFDNLYNNISSGMPDFSRLVLDSIFEYIKQEQKRIDNILTDNND